MFERKTVSPNFSADEKKVEQILELKKALGEDFPKISIFAISYGASFRLEQTINRIPQALFEAISEVFIIDDASPDDTFEYAKKVKRENSFRDKINIFRNAKNLGYGGNQKIGYRYAINQGHDFVIMLHGDGQYAPEFLPDLILPILLEKKEVVFGSRMINRRNALKGGMPLYKWIGNQVLTTFENFILGTKLAEFHSGYRLYSTRVLSKIPFEENTNDFHFDSEIIIQCRALNVGIHEVPIKTFYGDEVCNVNGMKYALDVCVAVLKYRLHQLHLTRSPKFIIDQDFIYTRKKSPYSSHEQILKLITKSGKALGLGSSSGFLTDSLTDKNIDSTCVDIVPTEKVKANYHQYIKHDLEDASTLNLKREYDYVIMADIIEHLRNALPLIIKGKDFLKEDGKVIISVPNIAIWIYRISLLIGRFNYSSKGTLDETHVRFYTLSTIKRLIHRSGLKITSIKTTGLPFEVLFESVGRSKIIKLIDFSYYFLTRIWPELFAYQFVIEAEPTSLDYSRKADN